MKDLIGFWPHTRSQRLNVLKIELKTDTSASCIQENNNYPKCDINFRGRSLVSQKNLIILYVLLKTITQCTLWLHWKYRSEAVTSRLSSISLLLWRAKIWREKCKSRLRSSRSILDYSSLINPKQYWTSIKSDLKHTW